MSATGEIPGAAPSNDVHERIRREADEVRALPSATFSDVEARPALSGLMESVMDGVEAAVPSFIDHQGRRYWIRVRVMADIGVYASPGDALPMVRAMSAGPWAGHKPGH